MGRRYNNFICSVLIMYTALIMYILYTVYYYSTVFLVLTFQLSNGQELIDDHVLCVRCEQKRSHFYICEAPTEQIIDLQSPRIDN